MAQLVDFAPGPRQSLQASRYFYTVCADRLEETMPDGPPEQLLVLQPGREALPLRIWSAEHITDPERFTPFLEWLRSLTHEVSALVHSPENDIAFQLASSWMEAHPEKGDLFLELLNPATAFTAEEDTDLSVGIVRGNVVMVSARNLIFTQLAPQLYGLSVLSLGSWLLQAQAGHHRQFMG